MGLFSLPIFCKRSCPMYVYHVLKNALPFIMVIMGLQLSATAQLIKMNIGIKDDATTASPVTFGVHPDATDGRDISLGENELPPIDPPGTLFAAFQWPVTEEIQKGYVDYRKRSDSSTFKRTYRLEFGAFRKGKAKLIWTYPLPPGIDSVRIIDRRSNGVNVNFSLDSKQEFTIQNDLWESFLIHAYFNNATTDLQEQEQQQTRIPITIGGNFITTVTVGNQDNSQHSIQLINTLGELCATFEINKGETVSLPETVARGTYFLIVRSENTTKTDVKTISIR